MTRNASGQTTAPAENTQRSTPAAGLLAIRWLFPAMNGPFVLLSSPRVVLGRGEDCTSQLPGTETSRHHAEVLREGPLVIVRDLDSRNGVFVNGRRIAHAPLVVGDVLRLGEWIGAVVRVSEASAEREGPFRCLAEGLHAGPVLAAALKEVRRAATSDLPIVLEGSTGTGKERVACAVHAWSGRRGPFVAVNCAALPEHLAEGELFGYRRGAFTGADRAHNGYFRAAEGGTLLLDELVELKAPLQAKLLRVLQQREVLPLGEARPVPIDVRVLAATQGPLDQAVAGGQFRADLYARLDGLTVRLPPLCERIEEIPYLFTRFLHERSGGRPPLLDPRLVEQLCLYDWPLNVRELELLVRRLLVLHGHESMLRRAHLPERIFGSTSVGTNEARAAASTPGRPLEAGTVDAQEQDAEIQLCQLAAALRRHRGNVSLAATELGISRQRAYRLMERRADLDLDALRQEGLPGQGDDRVERR